MFCGINFYSRKHLPESITVNLAFIICSTICHNRLYRNTYISFPFSEFLFLDNKSVSSTYRMLPSIKLTWYMSQQDRMYPSALKNCFRFLKTKEGKSTTKVRYILYHLKLKSNLTRDSATQLWLSQWHWNRNLVKIAV